MSTDNKSPYAGTLTFCIIASVVTIAILAMFFLMDVEPFKYLLLTVELCLVLIIVHSIVSIVMHEKKTRDFQSGAAKAPIPNLACPDYFTRHLNDSGVSMCENVFETSKTYVTIGPSLTQIDLSALNKKIASDACKTFNTEYNGKIPWTDMKSACETVI